MSRWEWAKIVLLAIAISILINGTFVLIVMALN